MKNVHILPTDKPSRLHLGNSGLVLCDLNYSSNTINSQHIYITSDEEIKDLRPHKGKWQLEKGQILNKFPNYLTDLSECKLVILTTDQDLIKDGVQAIDDTFLEWFVKNPSCEEVEVDKNWNYPLDKSWEYKIITPKEEQKQHLIDMMKGDEELGLYEESKQETLEEAAKNYSEYNEQINKAIQSAVKFGAKWQQEKMYSDMQEYTEFCIRCYEKGLPYIIAEDWFEHFKNK